MKRPMYLPLIVLLVFVPIIASANSVALNTSAIPKSYKGRQPYSIKYDLIQVRIDNNIAHTEVEQVLRNETSSPLETEILFPFPEGAAVTRYSMWMGEKRMNGELLDKNQARSTYQEIVRKKKDPALLQFVGAAAFRSSVYPVPPRGEKKLRFAYDEVVPYQDGVYKYSYILGTGDFSEKPFEKLAIEMKIHTKTSIRNVYSPTHEITVKRIDENTVEVSYSDTNVRPLMNFELYYTVSEDDIGLNLMTYKNKGEDGYFMVMATPKLDLKEEDIVAKDIVFVFDHSGSMSGEKIRQARGALEFCLNSLNEKDNFNLITFSTTVESLNEGLVKATPENVRRALDFVGKMRASGGTDIHSALEVAVSQIGEADAEIIFLTDGLPTIGPKEPQIVKLMAASAKERIRMFNFGVGNNVNTHFLDRLSRDHGGFSTYVRPEEDIEIKVSSFFSKITYPIFKEIKFSFGSIDVYDVYPPKLSAIFKGSQVLVFGRYRNSGDTEVRLTGRTDDDKKVFAYKTSFPEERTVNEFIPKIWASRKIGYLAEELRLNGTDKELIDEIVQLSKEYGIVTEFTSFLVHEDRNMSRAEMNEATEYNFKDANAMQNGSWAISQNVNSFRLQGNGRIFDNNNNDRSGRLVDMNGQTRVIGDRAFYRRNGQWIDSTLEKYKPEEEIKNFSAKYMKFSDDNEDYNRYMSVGNDVIINVNGRAVRFYHQ